MLGFQAETGWSRLALPGLHAWAGEQPLRLVQRAAAKDAPDPKTLSCYGLLRGDTGGMLLRCVDGRPVRQVTEDFLAWVGTRLAAGGDKGAAAGVGQRLLARQQAGAGLDQGVQPPGQGGRGRADHRVSLADQGVVAEPDRAEGGTREEGDRGARTHADGPGNQRACLSTLSL